MAQKQQIKDDKTEFEHIYKESTSKMITEKNCENLLNLCHQCSK